MQYPARSRVVAAESGVDRRDANREVALGGRPRRRQPGTRPKGAGLKGRREWRARVSHTPDDGARHGPALQGRHSEAKQRAGSCEHTPGTPACTP